MTTHTPHQWAAHYVKAGFAPIPVWLPDVCKAGECSIAQRSGDCYSPGKHPMVKWKDLGGVTAEDVDEWWSRWPNAGIALLTGARSGFDVLDVDPKNGGDLDAVLALDGIDRPTVVTGSGGWHVYLRHPGVDTSNGLADVIGLPGVDYRGDGGLVIAPPSTHASGGTYTLADGDGLKSLPPMPAWLVEAAEGRAAAEAKAAADAEAVRRRLAENPPEQLNGRDATPYGRAVLDNAVAAIRNAEPGTPGTGRHDTARARARTVGGFVASGEIDETAARRALLAAAVAVAGEARTAEMEEVIDYGLEHGKRLPLEKPDPDLLAPLSLASPPDITDDDRTDGPTDRYPDVDWSDVWDSGLDDMEWLIDGLVPTRRGAAIFSKAGEGKSLIMLEMAACIATGTPFAGRQVRQADVVYVDAENDLGDVIDRLKTFGFTPDQLGRLHYKSMPALPALDKAAGGQELVDLAIAHGAELVIIDTVARTVAGPENDTDTFRAYAKATGQKLKAAGIACWRIDHAGKDITAGQRGASGKNDDVDVVWQLDRDADQAWTLTTATKRLKKRFGPGLKRLAVVRMDDTGLLSPRERIEPPTTLTEDEEIDQLIAVLDEHDVPLDTGRPTIRRQLDIEAGNYVLSKAIKRRRVLAESCPEPAVAQNPQDSPADSGQRNLNAVPDSPRTTQDSEPGA